MVAATTEPGPITAGTAEESAIADLARLLDDQGQQPLTLVGLTGEQIELPESLRRVLREAIEALARDRAVTVGSIPKQLTTQQAANLLAVSRPYLVRLLDEGAIPFTKTGTHRRVRLDDLLGYKKQRDAKRREGLALISQLGQEIEAFPSGSRD